MATIKLGVHAVMLCDVVSEDNIILAQGQKVFISSVEPLAVSMALDSNPVAVPLDFIKTCKGRPKKIG
jgi:hypothetical protein